MIAVKSYKLYTILKHLFFISKQRITFKIISPLVVLVLNYTTKCLFFGMQIHFYVSRCSKTWKHFDFLVFPFFFSFLSQIYISSSLELNSNLVLFCVVHSDQSRGPYTFVPGWPSTTQANTLFMIHICFCFLFLHCVSQAGGLPAFMLCIHCFMTTDL